MTWLYAFYWFTGGFFAAVAFMTVAVVLASCRISGAHSREEEQGAAEGRWLQ